VKIYLAARYSRRDELSGIATQLRQKGHVVTSRWLETEFIDQPDQRAAAPPEYRQKYAIIDLEDVAAADNQPRTGEESWNS
jgi:DNA-binding GntR family transcriptional regulator